jgi:hypothetical protein
VLLLGLDGLWGGAGWEKVRHEAAEDDSEFHSVGGRWARWSGLKAGPGEHEQWKVDDGSCFFFYISGRKPHGLAQPTCLPSLCAIPAFGRRWRKAGLGVTDNEMRAWPGPGPRADALARQQSPPSRIDPKMQIISGSP